MRGPTASVVLGAVVVASAISLGAQSAVRFEVASVRPSPGQPVGPVGIQVTQSQARFSYLSLKAYIAIAFNLRDYQVDGPGWLVSTRFDIVAKMPEVQNTRNQVPAMMRALLEERFLLRTHRVRRAFPVYGLEVAPQGPPLVRVPDDPPPPGPFTVMTGPSDGRKVTTFSDGATLALGADRFEARRMSMTALADALTPFVGRPVVDMTNLEGRFDVAFSLAPEDFLAMMRRSVAAAGFAVPLEDMQRLEAASAAAVPDALERAGLLLRARRAPLDVLVIDRVERVPTDN